MHKFLFALILLASISMSSIAHAQRPGGSDGGMRGGQRGGWGGQRGQRPPSPLMMALDADKDGKLSAEEIANAAKALKSLDKNEDGVLDSSELMPPRGNRMGGGRMGGGRPGGGAGGNMGSAEDRINRMFELDKDKDGKISKEEGGERMANFFQFVDGDNDGFITREEFSESMKRWQGGGGGNRGGRGNYQQGPKSKDSRPAFDDD